MRYIVEEELALFEPNAGASRHNFNKLTYREIESLDIYLEDVFASMPTKGQLSDFFHYTDAFLELLEIDPNEFAYRLENHSGNHDRMTYSEMVKLFKEYNEAHGFTQQFSSDLHGAIVFKDIWGKNFTLESLTYLVSSTERAYLPNLIGSSIFGHTLDGSDYGVRLDHYMSADASPTWEVDYCYLVSYEEYEELEEQIRSKRGC